MTKKRITGLGRYRIRELNEASTAMITLIEDRYGRMPVILGIIVGLITSITLSLAGPSALTVSDYIAPLSFLFTLLTLSFVSVAGNIARELETGEAALYMYTRLGRTGYLLAWISAVELQTMIVVLISLTLPILFFAPLALLNASVLTILASILLQLLYHALILIMIAIVTRNYRRYLSAAFGFLIIFPLGASVFMSMLIAAGIMGFDTMRDVMNIIATITYPLFNVLDAYFTGGNIMPPIAYMVVASLLLPTALVLMSTKRMEV